MGYLLSEVIAAQHHADPSWPEVTRLTQKAVRVLGRDPSTGDLLIADGPGGNMPNEPLSLGYIQDNAVWYASGAADPAGVTRETPIWGGAFPAIISKSSGTQTDPYKSKVVSTVFAYPAFRQNPSDPAKWDADTGTVPQKVALAGASDLPGGSQAIVLPFSIGTEQQLAAFKASSEIIAVWRGGAARGSMGTLVYEVTPDGNLDESRRARDHAFWRVFRQPLSGLLPFGGVPNDAAPFPISSGLAWLQCLDVDGQAGYGMIADQPGGSPGPAPSPTPTGGGPAATSPTGATQEKTGTGFSGIPGTTSGPTPGSANPGTTTKTTVFGVTGRVGFGPFSVGQASDKHRIAFTPDGEPVNCTHWNVLNPLDGDGFDAPMQTEGLYQPTTRGGPLKIPVHFRYDQRSDHPFVGGRRDGLRRWQTTAFFDRPPPEGKIPGHDKGPGTDKTNSIDKAIQDKFGGTDKAAGTDKYGGADKFGDQDAGLKPGQDGSGLKVITDRVIFPGGQNKIGSDPATPPTDGPGGIPIPSDPFGPAPGSGVGALTFGGRILFGGEPSTTISDGYSGAQASILINRTYARTPEMIGGPGFIGRGVPLDGFDLRGRDSFTPAQQAAYEQATPITGQITAFGDQTGGSFRYFPGQTPGVGAYVDGSANAGGFVLTPSNVDARVLQGDGTIPPSSPFTGFMAGTFDAFIGVADPGRNGLPRDGYMWGRDSDTHSRIDYYDEDGHRGGTTELDPAIEWDSADTGYPEAKIWGGIVVTTYTPTDGVAPAGTVFVSDGTNVAPGGSWINASELDATPKGYCFGFGMAYDAAFPSQVTVSDGRAADSTNTVTIQVGDPSVDYLTPGILLGNDGLETSDTAITADVSVVTVSGQDFGYALLSADVTPFLNARALTGSVDIASASSGLSVVTATTPGTTFFKSEVAVGDLIGNDTGGIGWHRVVSITDDETLTVINMFNLTAATNNLTFTVLENPQFQAGDAPSRLVTEITPAGLDLYAWEAFNNGVDDTGLDTVIGQPAAAFDPSYPALPLQASWIYLFARAQADGTSTLAWSTQRTTPYDPAALAAYTFFRLVGVLPIGDDNFVPEFSQTDLGPAKRYVFAWLAPGSGGTYDPQALPASAGSATWVRLDATRWVPPVSRLLLCHMEAAPGASSTISMYVQESGLTTNPLSATQRIRCVANGLNSSYEEIPTDASQAIDYAGTTGVGVGNAYSILAMGYVFRP